jgi:hypothetical protein
MCFFCCLLQADHYLAETKAFVSQAAELKANSTILEQQNKDLKKKVDQVRAVVKRLHDMRSALASDKVGSAQIMGTKLKRDHHVLSV